MNRGDKLDVRTAEASKYSEEEGRSLLSHGSHEDDDYLIVEPSSTSGTPSSQSASTPKIPPSLSTSPTDQHRTGRTSNRVRFDIQDDGEEDTSQTFESRRDVDWIANQDYLDEETAQVPGDRSRQAVPLLTNIEAPSVTVATSDFIPEDHLENARPRSGLGSAFMNMANSIIGAGIIGQPYAFRQAGLTTGIILLVILTWTVDWTIRLIVVNSKLSGADSFQSTLEFCYGKTGLIAISVAQWAFAFGGMIAFCIIVGDTIPHVVMGIAPSIRDMPVLWLLTDRRAVIIIFVLGISYPLSLYRDIAKVCIYLLYTHVWLFYNSDILHIAGESFDFCLGQHVSHFDNRHNRRYPGSS